VQTVAIQVAPPDPAPAAVPVVVQPPPLRTPGRTLDNDEIAILYKRSQDLITQGDIAGGRLLLTRAAEAGDARAALALGATYDVSVLGKLAALGVVADAAKAKAWYAKAAELGSGEAVKRLEVLAHGR
jgi:TPR repeat protein